MIHTMRLNPEPFEQIACHVKIIEARINDGKRRQWKRGYTVIISNRQNLRHKLQAEISRMQLFPSFTDMFIMLGVTPFGFSQETTPVEAANAMRKYYSAEEEKEDGVVGITITVTGK